jgi:DNA-binding beta-propeller fold protein YncE
MWVANNGSNNVTQLDDATGLTLGTFGVGLHPVGIAFDGTNIWVSNQGKSTVTELRATDGTLLGTFKVGPSPQGVAFDGVNIWVANVNGVSKL